MLPPAGGPGLRGRDDHPLVLVADDHEETRLLFQEALQAAGFTVSFAEDGRQAVDLAGRHRPALVIMDLSMPALNGWEAIRALKLGSETNGIPILVVTAEAMHRSRELAVAAGCDGYLTKPCEPDELVRQVKTLLTKAGRR